jgi:hypothetical protein
MGLFNRTTTTTLLAREIKINENPASGENYLYVEGDETGFLNWILKKVGLKDPSISLSIADKYVTRINGGKYFSVIPTSEIHDFRSGFAKNKWLLLRAIISFLSGLFLFIVSIDENDAGIGFMFLLFFVALGLLHVWLYKRSGAMIVELNTFNGSGSEKMRVKSGLTGMRLGKENFEQLFGSLKNVLSNNSKYFRK